MKVVIVHYHLRPGGVTTVIRRHLDACSRSGIEAFLVSGEEPPEAPGVPFETVAGLAYDPPGAAFPAESARDRGNALARSLADAAGRLCGGGPYLFHVHNPTIRKNAALCPALSVLAGDGARILIQAHDFAEDWRPEVLPAGPAYPADCRWAVLNGRDYRALRTAGVPAESLELLPNPLPEPSPAVPGGAAAAGPRPGADLVLYPVRGIARKNLGEFLLLARWLPPGLSGAVTLPPNNPKDFPLYEAWKSLARETGVPVSFEAGQTAPLDDLYARARAAVTTSVKEGFGFSFLEPLARGVPVAGRRLPSIVPDFEAAGISFPGLYPALRVPEGLYSREAFGVRLDAALASVSAAFSAALGGEPDWLSGRMARVREAALPEEGADFGVLDTAAQAEVLGRLYRDPEAAAALEAANPFLPSWWDLPAPGPTDLAALSGYSPALCAGRLAGAYERTLAGGGSPAPDRRILARELLVPEGFFCPGL